MKYEAIRSNSPQFDVKKMCDVLGVKRGSYYRWLKSQMNREQRELKSRGVLISEYRVRRLMRENGFYPELAVKFKPQRNGKSDGRYCENKVKQEFSVKGKNKVWAGNITYIKTSVGWVYLAVVIDLFNREVIGYDLGKKIDTQLVKNALGNAIGRRGLNEGLIFHSDRGCQYASNGYQDMLREKNIQGSMSKPGCPYDNSCVESFFASLKKRRYTEENMIQ